MKTLFFLSFALLVSCNGKDKSSPKRIIETQNPSVEGPKEVETKPEVESASGEICDLKDEEEHETFRVFLQEKNGHINFYRLNERETIASPGLRTAYLDLYYMFKSSPSDKSWIVSLIARIDFKDRYEWKSYGEVITASPGEYEKFILKRNRYLRDHDKYTQKDWVESHPKPFKIDYCQPATVELSAESLPRRKTW